jgi:3D (Asp-Asp-Asp) domain-containing protein
MRLKPLFLHLPRHILGASRIMRSLVRGGLILSIVGALVVFVYAQTQTEHVPVIATDSQLQFNINGNSSETANLIKGSVKAEGLLQNSIAAEQKADQKTEEQDKAKDKKLVEKTVSSKAVGANRGSFVATAYCLRGRTASGRMVGPGVIAADPRVLKLGSRVNLGGARSGTHVVADTGGKIKGKRIDIWMASCADARRFGRRTVTVHVP